MKSYIKGSVLITSALRPFWWHLENGLEGGKGEQVKVSISDSHNKIVARDREKRVSGRLIRRVEKLCADLLYMWGKRAVDSRIIPYPFSGVTSETVLPLINCSTGHEVHTKPRQCAKN